MFPFLIQILEVCVIEVSENWGWLVIVHLPFAMELIDKPFTLVRNLIIRVIQFTISMHIIILPFSIVETTLLIIEFPLAITHAVTFVTLVPASILVFLDHVIFLLVGSRRCRSLADLGYRTKWLI